MKHEETRQHKRSVEVHNAKEKGTAAEGVKLCKMLTDLKMATLFRNAHAIAKKCRPFTDSMTFCWASRAWELFISTTTLSVMMMMTMKGWAEETLK